MKIAQAGIASSSEHQSMQLDAEIRKESREEISIERQRRRSRRRILSRVLVDRISLSHEKKSAVQSNYTGTIRSGSQVWSPKGEQTAAFEQQQTVEKMIGGIIDREVTVNRIRRNEDVTVGIEPSQVSAEGTAVDNNPQDTVDPPLIINETRSVKANRLAVTHTQIHFEEEAARFSSRGTVTTEDGRVIDFSLDMSLNRSFLSRTEEQTLVHRWQEEVNLTDPLVISLDGRAPTLTDAVFEFDLDSDGEADQINFAAAGSGFLALDKNEDGVINNGSELFGPGTGNGFNELSAFDEDQNQWIDENDAVFSKLKVWTRDEDGQDRLISLKDAGVGAISLSYADTLFNMTDSENQLNGQLKQSGVFLFENGNVGSIHQVDLVSHKPPVPEVQVPEPFEASIPPELTVEQLPVPQPLVETAINGEQVLTNPHQELLDRIEELKAMLSELMEKMNTVEKNPRGGGKRRHRSYEYFSPDPAILISGGRGRSQSLRRYG